MRSAVWAEESGVLVAYALMNLQHGFLGLRLMSSLYSNLKTFVNAKGAWLQLSEESL